MSLGGMRAGIGARAIVVALALAGSAALPGVAMAGRPAGPDVPRPGAQYYEGPSGRYLLGGRWYYRDDPDEVGLDRRWQRERQRAAEWRPITSPYAWNATASPGDDVAFIGRTGWFRKEFRLPSARAALHWLLRFESVSYRTRIWLNGKLVGRHSGAYLPFEVGTRGLRRRGLNILVLRVNNVRKPNDFPPSNLAVDGRPTGGWWNYGGILREVYLQKIDRVTLSNVHLRTVLPCRACAAAILAQVSVRNYSRRVQRVSVRGNFGRRRLRFHSRRVRPGRLAILRTRVRVRRPRLWSPSRPNLYGVRLALAAGSSPRGGLRRAGGYRLRYGIRDIRVTRGGILQLNHRPLRLRGVGLHEDVDGVGAALSSAQRRAIMAEIAASGAKLMRTHYPLHPELLELADRMGIFVWSEIPVYTLRSFFLRKGETRRLAVRYLETNIRENRNHPSVLVWSIGNELSSRPDSNQGAYIRDSVARAHQLDPSRPVGLAIAAYPSVTRQPRYSPLDVLGINDYFGWYLGPHDQLADRNGLAPYLTQMRAKYPHKALMVTEFGAEANRDGPVGEKGTYAFQKDFVEFHLNQYDVRPWLAGAIYWALREFRVRPGWIGGNPKPLNNPGIHQKGLLDYYTGAPKPAYATLRDRYRATNQTP